MLSQVSRSLAGSDLPEVWQASWVMHVALHGVVGGALTGLLCTAQLTCHTSGKSDPARLPETWDNILAAVLILNTCWHPKAGWLLGETWIFWTPTTAFAHICQFLLVICHKGKTLNKQCWSLLVHPFLSYSLHVSYWDPPQSYMLFILIWL